MTTGTVIASRTYNEYYDISNTITTAGTTDPNNFDSPVYNREQLSINEGRNAERVLVKNDGDDTLYVVVSHIGGLSYSAEVPIYADESKIYYNVYELRLRSPTQGNAYRGMEYNLEPNFMSNKQAVAYSIEYIPIPICSEVSASFSII